MLADKRESSSDHPFIHRIDVCVVGRYTQSVWLVLVVKAQSTLSSLTYLDPSVRCAVGIAVLCNQVKHRSVSVRKDRPRESSEECTMSKLHG